MLPAHVRGYTLFELIVVMGIVGIFAGVFLDRVQFYQEQAERASVEQVVAALQTALTLQFANLTARGRGGDAAKLETENPMNLLAEKPRNYAGEAFDPEAGAVAPGSWVFDLKSHDMIYKLEHGRFFTPGKGGVKWIRFHVNLMYEGADARGIRKLTGAVIQPVESYLWFDRRP